MLRSQPKRPSCRSRRHWLPSPLNGRGIEGERLSQWGARATGPYRPATRRTARVRRSSCQRTPFVIGASSFVIRPSQTEIIKTPEISLFYGLKSHPTMTQRIVANPRLVGRVTPCAPLLTSKSASHPHRHLPAAFLNT